MKTTSDRYIGKSLSEKVDGTKCTAKEIAELKSAVSEIKGKPDITIVQWSAGEWMIAPTGR